MIIHSLSITNVRAIEHLELHDLPDTGVILIEGDNESGKSTILESLDVVLNQRHSSKAQKISNLQPAGKDVSPVIELAATVGPYTFNVRKTFLKKAQSELNISAPKHEQYTGRQADDKLSAILNEHLDDALRQTLFLKQGALEPAIEATGIPSITRALDETASEQPGAMAGTEDSALMQRIEREYHRYFTSAGKEKSTFSALRVTRDEAREKHKQLRAEKEKLSGFVDDVARSEKQISDIDAQLPDAVEEESARAAEVEVVADLERRAEDAKVAAQRAATDLERAQEEVAVRTQAQERVDELHQEVEAMTEQRDAAQLAADEEAQRISELSAEHDGAKRTAVEARGAVREAQERRRKVRDQTRLAELAETVSRLDEVDKEVTLLRSQQPAVPVTEADIRHLEKLNEDVTVARRLLERSAAKLDVSGPAEGRVSVNGNEIPFDGTATVSLEKDTRLGIGDYQLTYRAAQNVDDGADDLDTARQALTDALAERRCDSVDQARALRDTHMQLASQLETALKRRGDILSDREAEELRAEHTRLRDRIDSQASNLEDGESSITEDDVEEELRQAQLGADAADTAVENAEAALAPWAEQAKARKLAVCEAQLESKTKEHDVAAAQLSAAQESTPKEVLEQAVETAQKVVEQTRAASAGLDAQLLEADPDLAADRYEGAKNRVRTLHERRSEAQRRIAELTGRIEQAAGISEQADRAEVAAETAEAALEAATRRAEAARLLYTTMSQHRDMARAKYARPFAQALGRYAARLFGPEVEFSLDDTLSITARTLGDATIELGQLSGGAKEQLALLVRFAIAELAGAGADGEVMPVVVDDALGATDPARLELMNSLFTQVGRDRQVIVLTCYPERFDRVFAARRESISDLTEN